MGRPGITANFLLELKLIADLGLVGLPNAGKSSLLRAISKARPRVGHWEFTTLQPTVGTIFTRIDKDPFTVADIPGIIKVHPRIKEWVWISCDTLSVQEDWCLLFRWSRQIQSMI